MAAVENHRIDLSQIDDEKALQYIAGFKRYSTGASYEVVGWRIYTKREMVC